MREPLKGFTTKFTASKEKHHTTDNVPVGLSFLSVHTCLLAFTLYLLFHHHRACPQFHTSRFPCVLASIGIRYHRLQSNIIYAWKACRGPLFISYILFRFLFLHIVYELTDMCCQIMHDFTWFGLQRIEQAGDLDI